MSTLLDSLQKRRSLLLQPIAGGGETAQAMRLLRAKTGKSIGSEMGASNIGEQVENQEAQRILDQELAPAIQTSADTQAIEAEKLADREREGIASAGRQRNYDTLQNRIQVSNLLNSLAQSKGQIDLERKGAALEQVGFLLAMQDRQYVDDIKRIGDTRRLTDKYNMLNEMQSLVFGDSLSLLQDKIGNENILASSRRDFQSKLSQMSIDEAIKIAQIEGNRLEEQATLEREGIRYGAQQSALATATANKYEGLSSLLSGAVQTIGAASSISDRNAEKARQERMDKLLSRNGEY